MARCSLELARRPSNMELFLGVKSFFRTIKERISSYCVIYLFMKAADALKLLILVFLPFYYSL